MADAGAIRAGKMFMELGVEGIDKVKAQLTSFGNALQTIGSALALKFGFDKATGYIASFADSARELFLQSRQLQITTDDLQEMRGAARELGIENEKMTMAVQRSRQYIAELAVSGKKTNDTMDQLGLKLGDVANLSDLDRVQKFGEALAALNNPAMTSRIGRQIFGRGGESIAAVASQLADARGRVGGGMSSEQIRQGFELSQSMQAYERATSGVGKTIGGILAPGVTTIYRAMTDILKQAKAWVAANAGTVKQIAVAGGLIVGISAGLLAIATTTSLLGFAFGQIMTLFGGIWKLSMLILSPWTLLIGSAAALGAYLLRDSDILSKFAGTGEAIKSTFGGIAQALENGDIGGAWRILTAGMRVTWYQLNEDLKNSIGVSLSDAFFAIRRAWTETAAFISSTWETIWSAGENAGTAVGNAGAMLAGAQATGSPLADALEPINSRILMRFLLGLPDGPVSPDVARATVIGNNLEQNASNAAARNRLAEIERRRVEALDRIKAEQAAQPQLAAGARKDLQDELSRQAVESVGRNALAAANRAASLAGARRGLEEFERGSGASGSFSSAALYGFGGGPFKRLEEQGQRQIEQNDQIVQLLDDIARDGGVAFA